MNLGEFETYSPRYIQAFDDLKPHSIVLTLGSLIEMFIHSKSGINDENSASRFQFIAVY
jgi:hypothetical protein